ncbi:MAG: hypothetical protein M3Y24_09065 [Acidobacteriota bacterium]|nr:hypothetical protein [Acidobacteriota bacterium]
MKQLAPCGLDDSFNSRYIPSAKGTVDASPAARVEEMGRAEVSIVSVACEVKHADL